jgi:DNA-binding MarR family transcriptional regulator
MTEAQELYIVKEQRREYTWHTRIPNIVDEMDLSPFEFRLYHHLKRVAGDDGQCYKNTGNLAKECKMSTGAVSNAKKVLIEKGLIKIEIRNAGGRDYHHITIIDIWDKNYQRFLELKAKSSSHDESEPKPRSPSEPARSPGEPKNNPIKNRESESSDELSSTKKRTRKRSELDDIKADLVAHFVHLTCISRPLTYTKGQRSAAAKLWWNPLVAIAKACDNDADRAKQLISWAISKMDKDELTISNPLSIEKVATGEQARRKRTKNGTTTYQQSSDPTAPGYVIAVATELGEWTPEQRKELLGDQ